MAKFKETEIGMIPEEWEVKRIGECLRLVKKQIIPSKENNLKYIRLEHIEQQSLRLNGIGSSADVESNKFEFKKGQILFGKLRPYFRKLYQPKFDGVCSTDIWVIDVKDGNDASFFFYFLADERLITESNNSSEGTKMPRARWDYLEKLEFPIPSLNKQKSIAKILSDLDSKIELNQQMNKTLESIGQAIFKRWFVEFEFPNEKGNPYKSSQELEDKFKILPRAILIAMTGAEVAKIGVVSNTNKELWLNQRVGMFVEYQELLKNKAYGSAQPNISSSDIESIQVILPNKYSLARFKKVFENMFIKITDGLYETEILSQIRDSLLPKLMSGKIRVPVEAK